MSSLGICVSFLLGNIFITSLSNCLSTNVSQTLPNEEHQEEKNKKNQKEISSAFQQVYKRTSLMSCLGILVCFLCLTCIQTQLFGTRTEEQAPAPDGVAERNVTGNMAAQRKAQHEPRHLADER